MKNEDNTGDHHDPFDHPDPDHYDICFLIYVCMHLREG